MHSGHLTREQNICTDMLAQKPEAVDIIYGKADSFDLLPGWFD